MNLPPEDVDKVAKCKFCRGDIEHYAGEPGSTYMTPFWRHPRPPARGHAAVPDEDTIQEVQR